MGTQRDPDLIGRITFMSHSTSLTLIYASNCRQASGPVKAGAGGTEVQLLRKSIHPLLVDQHGEVKEDLLVHRDFEFLAGGRTDILYLPGALSDEHALVAVVGRQYGG